MTIPAIKLGIKAFVVHDFRLINLDHLKRNIQDKFAFDEMSVLLSYIKRNMSIVVYQLRIKYSYVIRDFYTLFRRCVIKMKRSRYRENIKI